METDFDSVGKLVIQIRIQRLVHQIGPLPVINGVVTPINGLRVITLVIGVITQVITGRGPTL